MNTTNPMAQNVMPGMQPMQQMNMQQMPQQNMQQNPMHGQIQMMSMMPNSPGQMAQQPMMSGQMNQFNPQLQMTAKQDNDINQKYKTERCRHYETHKNCILREKCHFAHGDEELRKPGEPLTTEQLVLALKSVQYQNCNQTPGKGMKKKVVGSGGPRTSMRGGMGGNFVNNGMNQKFGGAPMGAGRGGGFQNSRGSFNGQPQTQNGQRVMQQNGYNKQPQQQQQNFSNIPNPVPTANFKTVKCRHFEKRGVCKYGDKCSYAHGDADLRSGQQNPTGGRTMGGQMRNNQMQPSPMGMDGMSMQNMQFPGMMMQNQMGFPAQGIYMDPNMYFNSQNSAQDPQNAQFQHGMMPNQFMHMQNIMGMQMQAYNQGGLPTVVHFKNIEKLQDGTSQQVNRSMTISPMEQSVDVQNRIKEVCSLLNGGQNEQAFSKLGQLSDEGKVQFQISKDTEQEKVVGVQMQKHFENAEQQVTQAK